MSVGQAIIENLEDDQTITAFVGESPSRIYPMGMVPERDPLTRITYQRITTDHGQVLRGANSLADVTMQLNCVAATYDEARDLAERVRLQMRRTTWPGTVVGEIEIRGVRQTRDDDQIDPPVAGREQGTFLAQQDFAIWHSEVVPA